MYDNISFFGTAEELLAYTRTLAMAEAARQYLETGDCHWKYLYISVE